MSSRCGRLGLAEGGLDALKESPAEFGERIGRDYERYREVVKSAGLKL